MPKYSNMLNKNTYGAKKVRPIGSSSYLTIASYIATYIQPKFLISSSGQELAIGREYKGSYTYKLG